MKITNETYVECPECGMEARNIDEIHRLFGYYIRHNNLIPNVLCKECRISQRILIDAGDGHVVNYAEWGNVAYWAKSANMKRDQFLDWLEVLGRVEVVGCDTKGCKIYQLTEMGRDHCKLPDEADGLVLWDYDTFATIVHERAQQMARENEAINEHC